MNDRISPKFPTPAPECPVCKQIITYHARPKKHMSYGTHRKFCYKCSHWVHGIDHCYNKIEECCYNCEVKGLESWKQAAKSLNLGSETFEDTCVMILASMQEGIGSNEEEISKHTRFPLDFIHPRGDRLRKAGIWKNDVVYLDKEIFQGPAESNTVMILYILCAEGMIERHVESAEEERKTT